jgi:hypothetical protein
VNAIRSSCGEAGRFPEDRHRLSCAGITDGLHQNRDDLVKALQNASFAVPEQGKEYVVVELLRAASVSG